MKKKFLIIAFTILACSLYSTLPSGINTAVASLSIQSKENISYAMAKATTKVLNFSGNNQDFFKQEVFFAHSFVLTEVVPMLPQSQHSTFTTEMSDLTGSIINKPTIDIEQCKKKFSLGMSKITALLVSDEGNSGYTTKAIPNIKASPTVADNNTAPVQTVSSTEYNIPTSTPTKTVNEDPNYISPETYNSLIEDLTIPSKSDENSKKKFFGEKINFDGEVRLHLMKNSSDNQFWDRTRSGVRFRLGMDTRIYDDWRIHTMSEVRSNIREYPNDFDPLNRIYVDGSLGEVHTTAGYFGYLMADGNIYDSRFKGMRFRHGDQRDKFKYDLAFGKTNDTSSTTVATFKYDDFDYSLETGAYNYRMDYENRDINSILTLGGIYKLDNYGVGALYLHSTLPDRFGSKDGYVLNAYYGELKSWRPGTFNLFAKYYNQPRHTYITHGMEGIGSWMHGFKGWGTGMNYTLKENLVAGLYYYNLAEQHTGVKGDTLWTQISYYF